MPWPILFVTYHYRRLWLWRSCPRHQIELSFCSFYRVPSIEKSYSLFLESRTYIFVQTIRGGITWYWLFSKLPGPELGNRQAPLWTNHWYPEILSEAYMTCIFPLRCGCGLEHWRGLERQEDNCLQHACMSSKSSPPTPTVPLYILITYS
jgi:hypothetical protein